MVKVKDTRTLIEKLDSVAPYVTLFYSLRRRNSKAWVTSQLFQDFRDCIEYVDQYKLTGDFEVWHYDPKSTYYEWIAYQFTRT